MVLLLYTIILCLVAYISSPGVRIGFEETLYTVREGDRTAVVKVAVLSGTLSSDVVVTLEKRVTYKSKCKRV